MKKYLLFFMVTLMALAGCANSNNNSNASSEEIAGKADTATSIADSTQGKVVLLDFYATWCGPCRAQSPVINELQRTNPDLEVKRIDVDENGDIAQGYGVQSIPTLIFLVDGQPAARFTGYTELEELETTYKELVKQ